MPVISATWKAKAGGSKLPGQTEQLSLKITSAGDVVQW